MAANQDIDRLWDQKSETIRHFLEDHPSYEQLSNEVAYTLRIRLNKANIEYSAVIYRAKKLNSFLDKIVRKRSNDPFTEITDFAGVRIVHLYKNDFEKISKIINEEFKVLKKVDKSAEQDPDRFGYDAVHFIVQLGHKSSGARYDGLKSLRCEIQVRTVLQDAWAIVSHHLVYKREADIPKHLKRKINSLSGLFSTADDQFDNIRDEREQFAKELEKSSVTEDDFLDQEINVDTVTALLKKRFPGHLMAHNPTNMSFLISEIDFKQYLTLNDLDKVLRRTKKAREQFSLLKSIPISAIGILTLSLGIADKQFRQSKEWPDEVIALIDQVEKYLED